MKELIPLIIAVITSNAVLGFIQFLITRRDIKKGEVKKIEDEIKNIKINLKYIDQGNIRLQLMFLIKDYPDREEEIIKLAKKYFVDFNGNYYLTKMFKQYLDEHKLLYPTWFEQYKDN